MEKGTRKIWKEHKVIGYIHCSLEEQKENNSNPDALFYIGYTDEEMTIINYGTTKEMIAAGLIVNI